MAVAAEYIAALGADLTGLEAGIKKAKDTLARLGEGVSVRGIDGFVDRARKSLEGFGTAATKVGQAISIGVTLPVTLMAREVIKAGSSFESAFAGVRKTVDATGPELAVMRQG